jgi:dCMP deaminase
MTDMSRDALFMNLAIMEAEKSVDDSVQNGAVLVQGAYNVIGVGFNGLTSGVPDTPVKWERPAKYMWVEHAERNAIYDAALQGNRTHGASMYCPWASCCDCARAIVQAGIHTLYRLPMGRHEGWVESIHVGEAILHSAGVQIVEMPITSVIIPQGLRLGQFRST